MTDIKIILNDGNNTMVFDQFGFTFTPNSYFFPDSSSHVVAWAQCMLGIFAPYKLLHLWLLYEEKIILKSYLTSVFPINSQIVTSVSKT